MRNEPSPSAINVFLEVNLDGVLTMQSNESLFFRNIRLVLVVNSILAILLAGTSLFCQTDMARISGAVTDPAGVGLRGSTVTISDAQHGSTRVLVTTQSGDYVAPNLPSGLYSIRAEADAFKTEERSIQLEVGQDVRIDLVLQPGDVSEKITVTEANPMLERVNDVLGGTLGNKQINSLPLNGRDFQNLLVLRPGVIRYPGGGIGSISANGLRSEENNFIVDGIDNNDPYFGQSVINGSGVQGTPATILPIDSIQEFNNQWNPTAEYGWKAGAVVNVGLKSGSNTVHGTAYDFERNAGFDSRNFFNPPPNSKALRLHQFGATVGGPVVRDKLFFFGGYEAVRSLVGVTQIFSTPATVSLQGDPANSIPDALADMQAHRIAENGLSQKLATLFPVNNGSNPNGVVTNFPNTNRGDNAVAKVDYHANDRHLLTTSYFIGDSLQTEQDQPVAQPQWMSQARTRAQVLGAGWVWMPNPRWVNEARVGYNRLWQTFLTADANLNPETAYGIDTGVTNPLDYGMPTIRIGAFGPPPPAGVFGGNNGWPQMLRPAQTIQFTDSTSYTRAKHALKFGGEVRRNSVDQLKNKGGKGRIDFNNGTAFNSTFNPPFPSATPLEDFLAGVPNNGRFLLGDTHRQVSFWSYAAFLQDDWRVFPRVTVNMGLRYELNTVLEESHDLLGNFDPTMGVVQVGDQIRSPYNGDHDNFGPRLGLVWDVTGAGRTILRAGGSLLYDMPNFDTFIGQFNFTNDPGIMGINVVPTAALGIGPGGTDGTGTITAGVLQGITNLGWAPNTQVFNVSQIDCKVVACDIFAVNRNLRNPYVTSWNMNLQQAVSKTVSLEVGYVGDHGTKLLSVYDINQVDPNSPAEINCGHCEQAGRPFEARFPGLKFINQLGNGYESNYNSLQATLTQRASHGLSYLLGYTYSHALDQASDNRAPQAMDSTNPGREYGSSDFDIRHRLTLAFTYAVPGTKSWGQLLQGWQLNSIVTMQTAQPWNVVDTGDDISLTGESADRWNFFGNPADFSPSHFAGIPWIPDGTQNAACAAHASATQLQQFGCFAKGSSVMTPPDPGTFGSMPRNLFRGPGLDAWDLSVVKDWRLAERTKIQFRTEFFNVLNHPSFANPYGANFTYGKVDPSSPSQFGCACATPDVADANPVIGTGGPRNIQLGVKAIW
jgi:hypothetical protein